VVGGQEALKASSAIGAVLVVAIVGAIAAAIWFGDRRVAGIFGTLLVFSFVNPIAGWIIRQIEKRKQRRSG